MAYLIDREDGAQFSYRDGKRWLWLLTPAFGLLPFFFIARFLATGNLIWTLGPLILLYGVIPVLDIIFGEDVFNPPEEAVPALSADPYYRFVAWLSVPLVYALFFTSMRFVATQNLPLWAAIAFIFGVGMINGGANNIGHELGHKPGRFDSFMARAVLTAIGNGHFVIEHNRGHHTRVSTPEDCSSSRFNENIYQFAWRDIPGALHGAWALEKRRLETKRLPFWSHHNQLLVSWGATILIAIGTALWLGWAILPFIILHHGVAIFALTLANYIEHYGLLRQKNEKGRYLPCEPHHSWNTNHIVSNLITIHLQRHSDHHANPMRPYQALRNFDDLPRLPSGYPGCFGLALVPPLWFKVMNPKVMDWAGGDPAKINHGPA